MTGVDGELYHKENTDDMSNPEGEREPTHMTGEGSWYSISVGENGQFFGCKDEGNGCAARARNGYPDDSEKGTGWTDWDTTSESMFKNFNAGHDEIWMVNVHNEVFRREGVNHETTPWGTGTGWEEVPGEMSFVATAEEGITWGIDVDGEVWRWIGGEISVEVVVNNIDHGWTLVENKKLLEVDVGHNAQVVGVNSMDQAFFRKGITEELPMGDDWF